MKSVLVINVEKIMAEHGSDAAKVVAKKYNIEKSGAQALINHIKNHYHV